MAGVYEGNAQNHMRYPADSLRDIPEHWRRRAGTTLDVTG